MLLLRLLLYILIAPWVVVGAVLRLFVGIVKLPASLTARSATELLCPAGHPNAIMGRWTCNCGAVYVGHAFAPCPVCGSPAGWMRCDRCGLALRSPWKNED